MLYEKEGRTIQYIDIPGCGGSSVNQALKENGWKKIEKEVPQHLRHEINGSARTNHPHRKIWTAWNQETEYQFAVVRNPYDKFECKMKEILSESISNDCKDLEAEVESLKGWNNLKNEEGKFIVPTLETVYFSIRSEKVNYGEMDNHFRPQTDFIGVETFVYKFEDGIDKVFESLIDRNIVDNNFVIPKEKKQNPIKIFIPWGLTVDWMQMHDLYMKFYQNDFRLFEYDWKFEPKEQPPGWVW